MADRSQLIRRLSRDLEPVGGLRSPGGLALAWWVGAWALIAGATLWAAPLRPGVGEQLLAHPRFAAESLLGLLAGGVAVAAAFALGVPGSGSPRRRLALGLGVLGLWVAAYLYDLVDPALAPSMAGKRPFCVLEVLLYGVPALVAGLLLLRRLAPLRRRRAGLLLGAAAGAVPALLMQLACMYVPQHILVFHLGPAVAVAGLGALLGPLLLRRI